MADSTGNCVNARIGLSNSNPHDAVKVIQRSDGKRRAVIFRRSDGLFGFRQDAHYERDYGGYWGIISNYPSVYATEDIAEREAYYAIPWMERLSSE